MNENDDHSEDDNGTETPNIVYFPTRKARGEGQGSRSEPMINLPPVTKWSVGVLLVVHLIVTLLPEPMQYDVFEMFGFVAARYSGRLSMGWEGWVAPFSYALLHGNWMHLITNGLSLAAFGAGVERWLGGRRMLVFMLVCSLAAVAVQFMLDPMSGNPVVGASGALSGLFAAILVMMQRNGMTGSRGILPMALVWIAISALFGLTGGPGGTSIAWAAHIGGFLAGFVVLKIMRV